MVASILVSAYPTETETKQPMVPLRTTSNSFGKRLLASQISMSGGVDGTGALIRVRMKEKLSAVGQVALFKGGKFTLRKVLLGR